MDVKVHISIFRVEAKMNSNHSALLPVVVVGGGISGLAAAHRLVELAIARPIRLLEAGPRLGGLLETRTEQGFQWEAAADGFHGAAGVLELCRRIGLVDEIVEVARSDPPAQVVHKAKLVSSPLSPLSGKAPAARSIFTTPLLSWRGKCRLIAERWIAADTSDDESCRAFFTRRFGVEFYTRLVEPVLAGVYAADPAVLSMQALLPHLCEMEQRWGSLTAAFRQQARDARNGVQESRRGNSTSWTLRRGMSSLVSALAATLPEGAIELNAPVRRIRQEADCVWRIDCGNRKSLDAAAVVLATPAYRAAHLLAPLSRDSARLLQDIAYSSIAVITLAFRRADVQAPLDSWGFFVPEAEPFELRSAGFPSLKYSRRAPEDMVLVRASLGGDHHATLVAQSDSEVLELAGDELSRLLAINGAPVFGRVRRHMFALPQYRLGHRQLVGTLQTRLADIPGLTLAGNAYGGIGVPQCITSGQRAAEQIAEYLEARANFRLGARVPAIPLAASTERLHA
jgi:oxygen-dependent protoporphyrinogen oxidase